jgi:hypothetical protein
MLDTPGTTDPIRPNSIGFLKQQDDAEGVRNALSPSDSTTLLNLATVMGRILLFILICCCDVRILDFIVDVSGFIALDPPFVMSFLDEVSRHYSRTLNVVTNIFRQVPAHIVLL